MSALRFQHPTRDRADIAAAAETAFTANPGATTAGVEDGWFGVGVPESLGGSGGEFADLAPAIEACGATMSRSGLPWNTGLIAQILSLASSSRNDIVEQIAGGEWSASIPTTFEHGAHTSGASSLSGDVVAIGSRVGALALPLDVDGTSVLAFVPADHPLVTVEEIDAMDLSRAWVRYVLRDLPLGDLDIEPVADLRKVWRAFSGVVFALDSVGAARSILAETIEYAGVREQFGRPLGSFQAYKHHCADAFIDLKLAQSVAFRAAQSLTSDEASTYAAASAVFATRAATKICARAIQLHGGIGFSWESGVHAYLRRARANEILSDRERSGCDLVARAGALAHDSRVPARREGSDR